jgi:1,2-diacylglycerol 3-alpha-glucosyltransferase
MLVEQCMSVRAAKTPAVKKQYSQSDYVIGILWAQYGPYHFARAAALKQQSGPGKIHALELANQTSDYEWERTAAAELVTLCPGAVAERLSFSQVFRRARRIFAELKLNVCILPSYAPKQSLAALLAAKSLGIRTVMMNESHAGTARARGVASLVKRRLVGLFDAALVGGRPQKRYFTSLGLPPEKIFTGYDVVDNNYFARRAVAVRAQCAEVRGQYGLPQHYFLSLGRFIAKKNLATLVQAYRKFLDSAPECPTHLVLVGSGEDDAKLHSLCQQLGLPAYDKTSAGMTNQNSSSEQERPGVHFYGFRQIDENPVFYALADAFILPSLWEEWGLVVNEAMASGLPVVVSETAGCAEDLLKTGPQVAPGNMSPELRGRLARLADRIRPNGFVFNPASAESLANPLIVLQSLPEMRENMGQASRTLVEHFSCENFARNALLAARAAMGDRLAAAATSEGPAGLPAKLIS